MKQRPKIYFEQIINQLAKEQRDEEDGEVRLWTACAPARGLWTACPPAARVRRAGSGNGP